MLCDECSGSTPEFAFATPDGLDWRRTHPGEMVNIPPQALHGFRNPTGHAVRVLITCTPNLGRFFEDAGLPIANLGDRQPAPPTPSQIHRVIEIAERYGQRFAPPV
jgi:hypothetical protein